MFRRFQSRSLILLYHRVAQIEPDVWSLCVSPENFAEHLEVLQHHRTVRLDQLEPGGWFKGTGLTCCLTFDDGYADNLHAAGPLLKRFGIPCTFFIATGYVDSAREFWWDELEQLVDSREDYLNLYGQLQPLSHGARIQILDGMANHRHMEHRARASHRALTSRELTKLASEDLFEIGAHTVTHPLLASQPAETQYVELHASKAWLEAHLNRRIDSMSYPYGGTGHYNRVTVDAAKKAGFARACTTSPNEVTSGSSPWELGRINIPNVGGEEFERILFA
jgi:peptidoglycan/xylan/chitin deacetylase (PgdA/CDA1 family)